MHKIKPVLARSLKVVCLEEHLLKQEIGWDATAL